MAQEALTNIAKHAHPDQVDLQLVYEPFRHQVHRRGLHAGSRAGDLFGPGDGAGYGLTGMRERAELLGGTLTAQKTCTGFPGRTRPAGMSGPIRVVIDDEQRVVRES